MSITPKITDVRLIVKKTKYQTERKYITFVTCDLRETNYR